MKNRSVIKVIIFSLITLGIYTLFWLRDTRKELVEHGQDVPPVKVLLTPIAALVIVAILQFVVYAAFGGSGSTNVASKGLNIVSILVGVIVVLALIPITVWWFYKYCKAVEVVTQGQTSLAMSFGLFILFGLFSVSFVWPGIIQDSFNRLPVIPTPGFTPPAAPIA